VLVESSGIFSNFCAENPPLLQAAKRWLVIPTGFPAIGGGFAHGGQPCGTDHHQRLCVSRKAYAKPPAVVLNAK